MSTKGKPDTALLEHAIGRQGGGHKKQKMTDFEKETSKT